MTLNLYLRLFLPCLALITTLGCASKPELKSVSGDAEYQPVNSLEQAKILKTKEKK